MGEMNCMHHLLATTLQYFMNDAGRTPHGYPDWYETCRSNATSHKSSGAVESLGVFSSVNALNAIEEPHAITIREVCRARDGAKRWIPPALCATCKWYTRFIIDVVITKNQTF